MSFKKYDDDKLEFDMIPLDVVIEIMKILKFGAKKYNKDNWKLCTDKNRYYNACMRHIFAYQQGEECDEETGMSHIDHAITNLIFMSYLDKNQE